MGHSDPDESCIHFPQHEGDLVGGLSYTYSFYVSITVMNRSEFLRVGPDIGSDFR